MMEWRALILLFTGLGVIYMFSLLQDMPYPHPAKRHVSAPSSFQHTHPNVTVLSVAGGYVYHTAIWYQVPRWNTLRLGSTGKVGHLRQQRQPLMAHVQNTTLDVPWEPVHDQILDGVISQYSILGHGGIEFAVLYHILDDDVLQHWIRVFYLPNDANIDTALSYKDIRLPGSTWISAFSLEEDGILYSRDPDQVRFRWATFPNHFKDAPHSMQALPIVLQSSQLGDPIKERHQPAGIVDHRTALAKVHASVPNAIRMVTLDIFRTRTTFFVDSIIADNASIAADGSPQWKPRYRTPSERISVLMDDTMEYMAFVDGVHFQHERVQLETPDVYIARSAKSKVVVMSTLRNVFYSWVHTSRSELVEMHPKAHEYAYREKDKVLPEFNLWIDGQAGSDEYDGTLQGVALDDAGHYLAAWNTMDSIFIYHRPDLQASAESYEDLLVDWHRVMVIPPQDDPSYQVHRVKFVELEGQRFLLVGLKNGVVQSYALDEYETPPPVNLWTFIKYEWYLWLPMSIVVFFFVLNEMQYSSRSHA